MIEEWEFACALNHFLLGRVTRRHHQGFQLPGVAIPRGIVAPGTIDEMGKEHLHR